VEGHDFSRAAKSFYFCHSEGTLVPEESLLESTFSAACLALKWVCRHGKEGLKPI